MTKDLIKRRKKESVASIASSESHSVSKMLLFILVRFDLAYILAPGFSVVGKFPS